MKTNRAFLAFAGSAVILLSVSSGARAQEAQEPPPPPPPDAIYVQRGVAVADSDVGPGPMMHEGIGFLGFEAGLGEKTVTGAPFSANFSTESTQTLADGNQIQHSSTGSIARDTQGRTRREMTLPAIGAFAVVNGESLSHVVFLKDPVADTRYVLEEDKKIAQQLPQPSVRGAFRDKEFRNPEAAAKKSEVVTTALGTQTIGGISAQGTRYTRTIPAGEIGNTKPIVIVNEKWYSPELQMVVMTKRNDPRSGDSTFQMTDIQRGEPAASLFQVPADYTISQGPPPHGVATFHIAGPPPPPEQ